jgi:transposase
MTIAAAVTLGVDTHKDIHVAVALDQIGRRLGTAAFSTDDATHAQLLAWANGFGPVEQAGVEGTGSFGYRLAQYLNGCGVTVFEVNRPNRQARRRRGKSDPVDAENAARAVLAGDATATPKSRTGPAGQLRALLVARRSAIKSRTQADQQLRSLILELDDLSTWRFSTTDSDATALSGISHRSSMKGSNRHNWSRESQPRRLHATRGTSSHRLRP